MANKKERQVRGDASKVLETDLANDKMGNNELQGNDQEDVRNQRHAVPDAKVETEGVIESFENMDPKLRAKRENAKREGKTRK